MTNETNHCKRPRFRQYPITAALFALTAASCFAQNLGAKASQTQSPQGNEAALAQVTLLANRVKTLEQKLATLEKRVSDDEAPNLNAPADSGPGPKPAGLSQSDEARLAKVEKQVNQLEADKKDDGNDDDTHTVPHPKTGPTRVTAPFEVVDSSGTVILSVQGYKSGVMGGLQMKAPDGSTIQMGAGTASRSALRIYDGPTDGDPRLFLGFEGSFPALAIGRAGGAKGTVAHLFEHEGGGLLSLYNGANKVGAFLGVDEGSGKLSLSNYANKPFADISANQGRGELSLANAAGEGEVVLGASKHGNGELDLLNSSGKNIASLASVGDNGELDLFNSAGQTVALIGSNPTNSEGHAVFTDAGGTPLAKLGAAGPHGDVLLYGSGKGVAVWEMTLTGFH